MGPLEVGGIVAATVVYLVLRGIYGPKLSDGRGRERRDETLDAVELDATVVDELPGRPL